jgi:hypothetical protein
MFMRFLGIGPGHQPLLMAIGDKFQDAWLAFTGNAWELAESADVDIDHEELPTTLFQKVQPNGLADDVGGGNEGNNEEADNVDDDNTSETEQADDRTSAAQPVEADFDNLEQELEGLEVGGDHDDDILRL